MLKFEGTNSNISSTKFPINLERQWSQADEDQVPT